MKDLVPLCLREALWNLELQKVLSVLSFMIDVGGPSSPWMLLCYPWASGPDGVRKQTEQVVESKPVSNTLPWLPQCGL